VTFVKWLMAALVVLLLYALPVSAQDTATPSATPTSTHTPTPTLEPARYITIAPGEGTPEGQLTRLDYTVSAGDIQIANLLTWLLYSVWGMFLFGVLVLLARYRNK
jgi:hypothetical protein